MYTHSSEMIATASRIADALKLEPAVKLNLSGAGPTTVAAFIFCNLWREVDEPEVIQARLKSHGCPFNRETIEFLLEIYNGGDPTRHLWRRDELEGFFIPLFDPITGAGDVVVN